MNSSTIDKEEKVGEPKTEKSHVLLIPKDPYKFNNLNFLRSLLAILVLWGHCFLIFYGTEEEVEPFHVWSEGQTTMAMFAINFFFVISGFLVLSSWDKRSNIWVYLKKRGLRIYPAFFVVSVVCLFVFGPLGTSDFFRPLGYWKLYFQSMNWEAIPKNILLLNEPSPPWVFKNAPVANSLNLPLWTIKFEFICFLTVPLLAMVGCFKYKIVSLILFVSMYGVYLYQYYTKTSFFGWQSYPYIGQVDMLVQFFAFFSVGLVYYKFRHFLPRKRKLVYICTIVVLVTFLWGDLLVITLPIFGSYILFYAAFARSYSLKGFAKWGDFSYGIYLYAWPLQQLMLLFFEKHMDITLLFILSTSFTICFAYLSWHYVEKPSIKLKDYTIKRLKISNNI